MPLLEEFEGVDEHQNIEQKAVADEVDQADFEGEEKQERGIDGELAGGPEAENHRQHVTQGIQNSIPVESNCHCVLAVILDHKLGVFKDLPAGFDKDSEQKAGAKREVGQQPAEEQVKQQPVGNMGECVPISKVLRNLGGEDFSVPELQ